MTTRITFKEFAQQIGRVACKHRQKIIAIDGGGGAGKTTFASYLQQAIAGSTIVKIDDFYRPPQLRTPLLSTKIINPNFDWDRLRTSVLEAVKEDREIRYQLYDFKAGTLSGEIISIPSDVTIIVEGVWSLQEAFRGFYDYRIWLRHLRISAWNAGWHVMAKNIARCGRKSGFPLMNHIRRSTNLIFERTV